MKINKLALMMLALSTSVLAEQKLNNITLDRVTLFLEGAELHGKTDVTLVKGENDIIVSGVSNVINPDSMTIGFENMPEIKILSVKTRDPMNVITDESDLALYGESDNQGVIDEIKSLRTKKKELETEYQATEIEFAAVSETIALLQGNHIDNLIKNSPNMVADMKSVLDFVKSNLTSALNEQAALQAKLEDLNAQVGEYQSQIEQKAHKVNTTARADNRIALKVYSDKDITVPLSLSYTIDNAGWTPDYDLHVTDINSPLQLTYKAYVYQNSGLDWHDINFTLSTATLNKTESAPDRSLLYRM